MGRLLISEDDTARTRLGLGSILQQKRNTTGQPFQLISLFGDHIAQIINDLRLMRQLDFQLRHPVIGMRHEPTALGHYI